VEAQMGKNGVENGLLTWKLKKILRHGLQTKSLCLKNVLSSKNYLSMLW
jgi:hypothetical protein